MLPQLEAACRFDPGSLVPLLYGNAGRVGWLAADFATVLQAYPEAFAREHAGVRILSPERMDHAVRELARASVIRGWRDERYEVRAHPDGDALFLLERAAFRRFGLLARAAHLNGWVTTAGGWKLWVARRSPGKPIDPGMLDNLVGGGIAAGASPESTLLKECDEEAGIAPTLARGAVAAGRLRVRRRVADGVHDELIHAFDLELPAQFVPRNRDGEVAEFMLFSPAELGARLAAGEFTVDAAAATMDFLWRRAALDDPRIGEALERLRAC